jgi:hypothetical protein
VRDGRTCFVLLLQVSFGRRLGDLATGRKSPWNSRNEMIAEMAVEGLAAALRGFFFAGPAALS